MVNFFNIDCVSFMKSKPDKFWDLAIVDPEYGININHNIGRRKGDKHSGHKKVTWDSKPPEDTYFKELLRVSKNQIIWGGNYFPYIWNKGCKCFIIWDKLFSDEVSFSMYELAWTSFDKTAKGFKHAPQNDKNKIHPTQKSIELYRWTLQQFAKPNDKILDTHGGSMSSAIACDMEGFSLDICEIDKEYFNAGVKRFENYKKQGVLFAPEQMKHEQTKLIL